MINRFDHLSTRGFSIIAFQETIVLILILSYSYTQLHHDIWIGVIIMLTIHWLITIVQSLVLRRIIPGTLTSIIGVLFGIYMIYYSTGWYPFTVYMQWGTGLFIFAMVNLLAMHYLVSKIISMNKRKG